MTKKISRWKVTQGEDFQRYLAFPVRASDPVEYADLSDMDFAMQVRAEAGKTGAAEATATTTLVDHPITGDADAAILVHIPASVTTTLKAGRHAFDVFRIDAAGIRTVVLAGEFYVEKRVTIIP